MAVGSAALAVASRTGEALRASWCRYCFSGVGTVSVTLASACVRAASTWRWWPCRCRHAIVQGKTQWVYQAQPWLSEMVLFLPRHRHRLQPWHKLADSASCHGPVLRQAAQGVRLALLHDRPPRQRKYWSESVACHGRSAGFVGQGVGGSTMLVA